MNTRKLGNLGERTARYFLEENGFKILETNWQYKHKEIDIIALKDSCLHFVEVKTRKYSIDHSLFEVVTKTKQKNIMLAAEKYLEHFDDYISVSFDVILIISKENMFSIDFISDAYTSFE